MTEMLVWGIRSPSDGLAFRNALRDATLDNGDLQGEALHDLRNPTQHTLELEILRGLELSDGFIKNYNDVW